MQERGNAGLQQVDARPTSADESAFDTALLHALRNFNRLDHLSGNPLTQSRLVARQRALNPQQSPAQALRLIISEATTAIGRNPKYQRCEQILRHTYVEPKRRQREVSDALYLSWSSYRRHLREARCMLKAQLWDSECSLLPTPLSRTPRPPLWSPAGIVATSAAILALIVMIMFGIRLSEAYNKPLPVLTIAVARFSSVITPPHNADLSSAITQSVVTSLSQLHDVHVIDLADDPTDPHYHMRTVNGIVRGSIEQMGGALRVDVELINPRDNETCWSDRVTLPRKQLMNLEDRLQMALASALHAVGGQSTTRFDCS